MNILRYFIFLLYLIIAIRVNAADVEISGTQATREDLQDSSTLTISGTLDGNLNNIVRGYTAQVVMVMKLTMRRLSWSQEE